jgi:hypothetical protein
MDTRGAINLGAPTILLKPEAPDTAATFAAKQLTQLIRVGGRLAVLGVEDNTRAMGWWHIMQPGSHGTPQGDPGAPDQEGRNLVYGKSLCGKINIVSNGYAADWRPPKGQLCPACAERV